MEDNENILNLSEKIDNLTEEFKRLNEGVESIVKILNRLGESIDIVFNSKIWIPDP